MVQLPADCIQSDTNLSSYDVGFCGDNAECSGDRLEQMNCRDVENYCCQPNQTQEVVLSCTGYSIPVVKVLSCKCDQCVVPTIRIRGKVVSNDAPNTGIRFI